MPNWCECELDITGESNILKELLDKATTNEMLDANKIIPYPTEFLEMDKIANDWDKEQGEKRFENYKDKPKDGFNSGGYEWCNKYWGTKWDSVIKKIIDSVKTQKVKQETYSSTLTVLGAHLHH